MKLLGALFIACLAAFFGDVAYSPQGMVFAGWASAVSFFVLCAIGLVLAVHAL